MADPAYLYAPVIGLLVGGLMVLRKDQSGWPRDGHARLGF